LDAGDTFHGQTIATLNKGESIADIMNAIGYDAMTPGNHDFNYGYDGLVELDGITSFPTLAAKVKKADGTDLFTPYIIKEIAGLKVGIFAFVWYNGSKKRKGFEEIYEKSECDHNGCYCFIPSVYIRVLSE
ncbi:MAG: hypothetical protein GX115_15915, partial [Ruminiclostridium sp.]|nr:hypothetical protein [Ruminiclostridium sp.]